MSSLQIVNRLISSEAELDSDKIKKELKWKPKITFIKGLEKTFDWYKDNQKYFSKLNKQDILRRLGKKND